MRGLIRSILRTGRRLACVAAVAVVATGCGELADLGGRVLHVPTVTRLEVFNRTEEAVFLLDANGARLDVPACGRAIADAFVVDEVTIRTEIGYVSSFGAPEPEPMAPRPLYLVITPVAGDSFPGLDEPAELPPCAGKPASQPGV